MNTHLTVHLDGSRLQGETHVEVDHKPELYTTLDIEDGSGTVVVFLSQQGALELAAAALEAYRCLSGNLVTTNAEALQALGEHVTNATLEHNLRALGVKA